MTHQLSPSDYIESSSIMKLSHLHSYKQLIKKQILAITCAEFVFASSNQFHSGARIDRQRFADWRLKKMKHAVSK